MDNTNWTWCIFFLFGGGCKGGRVDLGGIGIKWDHGAVCEIPKSLTKILCVWGGENLKIQEKKIAQYVYTPAKISAVDFVFCFY